MPDRQAIYHKTPQGMQAIANRQSGLAPRLRSLLILVDGKRSSAELTAMVGECEPLLQQMAQGGLIAPVDGAWPDSDPTGAMAATAPMPLEGLSLGHAKRFATRLLTDLLGPSAEVLCLKIESAGNLAEFVAAIKRAREIVRDAKGSAAAEVFVLEIEAHTPGR